jgi:16S rRNA (uracil1498-N3)-methyltransferase
MTAGQEVVLFNGQGGEYRGQLIEARKGFAAVKINAFESIDRESPLPIHLAIGISRGERMDWIVQKATELGVKEITPLFTQRCEVKLTGDRLAKKIHHWQQVAISACEQCQRTKLPIINPASPLPQWLPNCAEDLKLVMHHRADIGLQNLRQKKRSVCLLIGPEGGLSDQEIEGATHRGFQALAMGPRVLRTETAPVAAISILQALWGDLQ